MWSDSAFINDRCLPQVLSHIPDVPTLGAGKVEPTGADLVSIAAFPAQKSINTAQPDSICLNIDKTAKTKEKQQKP